MNLKIKKWDFIKKINQKDITKTFYNKNPMRFMAYAIVGVCFGVICETLNYDVYSTIDVDFVGFIDGLSDFSIIKLFLDSSMINLIFLLTIMFLGLCAIGYIFIGIVPFIKGLGIGSVCGYLYYAYAIKGVLYSAVIVFPVALIQLVMIILSCNEATLMSRDILICLNKKENAEIEINLYILRFSVIFLIMSLSSVIYILMSKLLLRIH